jgi:O-antigen/teichoic acid export membrane protein
VCASIIAFLLLINVSTQKALTVLLLSGHQIAFALARTSFAPALAEQRMRGPAVAELLCRAGIVSFSIALVAGLGTSLAITLVPFMIGGLLLLAIAFVSATRYLGSLRIRTTWNEALSTVRAAWPFGASLFVFSLRWYGVILVIAFVLGDHATGLFSSSLKLLQVGVMPLAFLGLAAYPQLSHLFELKDPGIVQAFDRLLRLTLALGALITWGLFFVVPLIVVPLLGAKFTPAISIVQAMAVLAVLSGLAILLIRQLMAMHLQAQYLKIYFSAFVFNLLLTIVLLPIMGMMGAVVAWIITACVSNALYLSLCQRHLGTKILAKNVIWFVALMLPVVLAAGTLMQLSLNVWALAITSLVILICVILLTGFLKDGKDHQYITATVKSDTPLKGTTRH